MAKSKKYKEALDKAKLFFRGTDVHWVVDGQTYHSIANLLTEARARGYNGSKSGFESRVLANRGCLTWIVLAAPVNAARSSKANQSREKAKEEMQELIRAMDARKAPQT